MQTETETETNRALEQAKAQVSSILEMVRALDRETAAEDYVETLEREQCEALYSTAHDEADTPNLSDEDLKSEVAELLADETVDDSGFEFDEDEARERIQEDALSVEVRSGWATVGETLEPSEFCILLCTGGPAVRIVGELNEHKEPDRARIEHQDWFKPWTTLSPSDYPPGFDNDVLLTYCRQFYFGE